MADIEWNENDNDMESFHQEEKEKETAEDLSVPSAPANRAMGRSLDTNREPGIADLVKSVGPAHGAHHNDGEDDDSCPGCGSSDWNYTKSTDEGPYGSQDRYGRECTNCGKADTDSGKDFGNDYDTQQEEGRNRFSGWDY